MPKKTPINKHFVSDIDKALEQFDKAHQPSAAQQAEIDKYRIVHKKRDKISKTQQKKDIWDF